MRPLAVLLGLAGCTPDARPDEPAASLEPGSATGVVPGPVVADASSNDWGLILSEPPDSRPGVVEVFTGSGDDRLSLDRPLPIVVVQAHHTGDAGFVVQAIRDDGTVAGTIDVVGPYTGELLSYEGGRDTVGFEVRADGPWALLAQSLVTAPDGEDLARRYEGAGDAVVGFPMDFEAPTRSSPSREPGSDTTARRTSSSGRCSAVSWSTSSATTTTPSGCPRTGCSGWRSPLTVRGR